jgi:ammonium transporter, Amt family
LILGALDFTGRYIPALRLRASPEEEMLGIDDVEIGEFAVSCPLPPTAPADPFQYDYVELSRDIKPIDDIEASSQTTDQHQFVSDVTYNHGYRLHEESLEKSNESARPLRFVDR